MEFNYKQFLTENKLTSASRLRSLNENHSTSSNVIISGKPVNLKSIEIDNLRGSNFDEKNVSYAEFEDGSELSEEEILELQEEYDDVIYDIILDKLNETEEEDTVQDEPTSKDIKASKGTDALAKKQYQLATLLKRKDELVSKFKSNEISIDQYKQMIGNIPQHIKTLTADIERLESKAIGNMDESKDKKHMQELSYEALERIEGLINRRELELFKNALENITNELEQEGFELSDIKAYIQRELDEILGIYK